MTRPVQPPSYPKFLTKTTKRSSVLQHRISNVAGASGPFAWMISAPRSVLTGDGFDVNENVTWDTIYGYGDDAGDYFTIDDDAGQPVINIADPDPYAGVWAYWFSVDCIGTGVSATVARLPAAMHASVAVGNPGTHPSGLLLNDAAYAFNNAIGTEMNIPAGTAVPSGANSDHLVLHSSGIVEVSSGANGAVSLHLATTGGIRNWDYSASMYLIRLCGFQSVQTLFP